MASLIFPFYLGPEQLCVEQALPAVELSAMDLDAVNTDPNEIAILRQRIERLEREMAELRGTGAVSGQERLEGATETQPVREAVVPPPLPAVDVVPPSFSAPPPAVSFENRLGSQIFNRIAIVALLIGTAYGLKLAIDNGLLGPVARVLIGLIAGAGLVFWSERFRRQGVVAFSYSLKAVGSGVLYLSLWAAFQLFHLLPGWAALAAMILVTAWNAFMAWSQDAELLAAYALIGGFLTPVLLSTGGNHEIFVFTYVLAIDAATVALIRLKRWPRLLLGTFPATVLYFIGWYSSWYAASELGVTAFFLVLFWSVFVAASLGDQEAALSSSPLQSVLLPLGAAAFLGLGLYSMFQDAHHHDWLPWLMLVLAAAYLGLMRLPQRRPVSATHLSLAVVFLTIAIPLKASGRWITIAWLVEGAALFWASTRIGTTEEEGGLREPVVLRWLASGALALGFTGVFVSPYWFSSWMLEKFFQKDVGTALTGVVAFAAVAWLAQRHRASARKRELFAALLAVDLLALLLCLREVVVTRYGVPVATFVHADLGSALAGLAILAGVTRVALQLVTSDPEQELWPQLGGGSVIAFNAVAVLAGVREIAALWRYGVTAPGDRLQEALAISAFLMVYGAAVLGVGFWRRRAFVRWQGLALLVFTIGKTFLFDTRSLSAGYQVMSFLGLGVLLMGVSFAYQRDWLGLATGAAQTEETR